MAFNNALWKVQDLQTGDEAVRHHGSYIGVQSHSFEKWKPTSFDRNVWEQQIMRRGLGVQCVHVCATCSCVDIDKYFSCLKIVF